MKPIDIAIRTIRQGIGGLALALALAGPAQAASLADVLNQTKVDGNVRSYYFTRQFTPNQGKADLEAFALGGRLDVTSGSFAHGFSVVASVMTAQSLGLNHHAHVDTTLMGAKQQITVLGQAYLQYTNPMLTVRAGDQLLHTPWMNPSDSRIIPATYQAVLADVTPLDGLHIYAIREYAWKSRTSGNYFKDNQYYPTSYAGDTLHGGQPFTPLPATAQAASGTLAFGLSYANKAIEAKAWYYDFYRFARSFYGEAKYTLHTGTGFAPFIGAQYLRQHEGNSYFSQYGITDQGLGGSVDATVPGAIVGLKVPNGEISVAYDRVDYHAHALGGGVVISPFTANYATDPLYTTSMIRGLVELGPGHAWKLKGTYRLFGESLRLIAAYAAYTTHFKGNSNNTYLDVTYFPARGSGLSIRDRVEVSRGRLANGVDRFVYNRVMMEYDF